MTAAKSATTGDGSDTIGSLQNRLSAADNDTRLLMQQLIELNAQSSDQTADCQPKASHITPFKATASASVSNHSFDDVVSRLCHAEALIDTLKSHVKSMAIDQRSPLPKSTGVDAGHQGAIVKEQWPRNVDVPATNMDGLSLTTETLRLDMCTLQKSQRWVSELKERLAQEVSLRASLEAAQRKLLRQLKDAETSSDASKQQVRELDVTCVSLKKEVTKLRGELHQQNIECSELQQHLKAATTKTEGDAARIDALEKAKMMLMRETGKMRSRYVQLSEQMDLAKKRIQERQRNHEALSQNQQREESDKQNSLLQAEREEKRKAIDKCSHFEKQLADLTHQATADRERFDSELQTRSRVKSELEERIAALENEKHEALQEKEALLDEVNQAVDAMSEERDQLQAKLEQVEAQHTTLQQANQQLRDENTALSDHISAISEQQNAAVTADSQSADADLTADLTAEITTLRDELKRVRASEAAIQLDNEQLRSEVNELQQQAVGVAALRTELTELKVGHDSALQEGREKLDLVEKEKHKLTTSLASLTSSYGQLQLINQQLEQSSAKATEAFAQLELQSQQTTDLLRAELVGSRSQMAPLQQALRQCRHDNGKMANSLSLLLESNSSLQKSMNELHEELKDKSHQLNDAVAARDQDAGVSKEKMLAYEEQVASLQQQLNLAREKAAKRNQKDVQKLRRQLDELIARNGELAHHNSQLRRRANSTDRVIQEQRSKLVSSRAEIDRLLAAKQKQADGLHAAQEVNERIAELERTNKEHERKSTEQARTIENFMERVSSLKNEIVQLVAAQTEMSAVISRQEEQLNSRREEADKDESSNEKESRFVQTNSDVQIVDSLKEAELMFKTNIEELQAELDISRSAELELSRENAQSRKLLQVEKNQASETVERAKAMIKASRETISQLADFAEESQHETLHKMRWLQRQLEVERGQKRAAERRLQSVQNASLRLTEELAGELNHLKADAANRSTYVV